MDLKGVITLGILIISVPSLLGILSWVGDSINDTGNPDHIEEGVELLIENATPWWLGPFKTLSKIPGKIGSFLLLGFTVFLFWIGEIKK